MVPLLSGYIAWYRFIKLSTLFNGQVALRKVNVYIKRRNEEEDAKQDTKEEGKDDAKEGAKEDA